MTLILIENEGTYYDCIDLWDGLGMIIQGLLCIPPLFLYFIGKTDKYFQDIQYILDISLAVIVFVIMGALILIKDFNNDDNL